MILLMTALVCLLYVSGCRTVQRDYFQPPPPVEAQSAVLQVDPESTWEIVETAVAGLDQYRHVLTVSGRYARFYRVGQGSNLDGLLLVCMPDPSQPGVIALEVRFGSIGNPTAERDFVDRLASSIESARHGGQGTSGGSATAARPGTELHTTTDLKGRWIDLDSAVSAARLTPHTVTSAVISTDRWRFGTVYELRTLDEQPATLVVVGDVDSAEGPRAAMMRIGHFDGDQAKEKAFLKRLAKELSRLSKEKRWPGSR